MSSFDASQVFGTLLGSTVYATNATIGCNDPSSPFRLLGGFEFGKMWTITQNYFDQCGPSGEWLYGDSSSNSSIALTLDICVAIAGSGFALYPKADVLARLITWKAPLIQLIATFPRSPLGFRAGMLAVLHLVSDPIGSFRDLLWKLESCQRRAVRWTKRIRDNDNSLQALGDVNETDRKKLAQALSIITESYDELGEGFGDTACSALKARLKVLFNDSKSSPQARQKFLSQCFTTAGFLRADRSTVFLPVVTAETIFVLALYFNIVRLLGDDSDRKKATTFVNIEVHSAAFSALFFWLICHVAIAAVIGTSQTEKAIPRILRQFQRCIPKATAKDPRLPGLTPGIYASKDRWLHGGNYSLQPLQSDRLAVVRENAAFERQMVRHGTGVRSLAKNVFLYVWPAVYLALPWAIFMTAILMGLVTSLGVPPGGWTCRSTGELVFALIWAVSYPLTRLFSYLPRKYIFGVMFCKDLIVTLGVIGWILATQVGVFNRCGCYVRSDGRSGLTLPQQPDAWNELQAGLRPGGHYLTTLGVGIFFLVIVYPGLIFARYRTAIRTFLQKDKCSSEASYHGLDEGYDTIELQPANPDEKCKGIDERIDIVEGELLRRSSEHC